MSIASDAPTLAKTDTPSQHSSSQGPVLRTHTMVLAPSPSSSPARGRRPTAPAADSSSPRSRPPPSTTSSRAAATAMLPDDVLARCLAYLSSPLELATAGAACHAWRGVARGDDLWWPFVVRAWPSLRRFLPPWARASRARSMQQQAPSRYAPTQPMIRGPLCRLFALRLPLKPRQEDHSDEEGDDEEREAGSHGMSRPYASSSDDDSDSSSSSSSSSSSEHAGGRRQTARVSLGRAVVPAEASASLSAAAGAPAPAAAQAGSQLRWRQLQVPLRAEDLVLHIEIRDLDNEDEDDGGAGATGVSWRRRLGIGRSLYSAAFCLADPRAFWLAVYNATRYRPRTLPGAVVDARRLAALLSDNLDELNSPLLRIDVAALHLPTGAVLHLPWRHSTLQLVQSFSLEEAEPNLHPHGADEDDEEEEDSNAIRLILDGGARGPIAKTRGQRLDVSFCPAIDLPTGDPSHPRPAILRTAPVELRIYDFQMGEYLDETGMGDRGQATGALLRFFAAVGSGGGGWRA